jgi:LPXTG-motif cell wall-anchored protein
MFRRLCVGLCAVGMVAGATFVSAPNVSAATLTVTTVNDFVTGSFRAAVAAAAPGDVIVFDPALNGQTITLELQLTIAKDLTINGNGPSNTIIVPPGTNLKLRDAQITMRGIQVRNGANDGLNVEAFDDPVSVVLENMLITGNADDGIDVDQIFGTVSLIVRNSTVIGSGDEGIEVDNVADPGSVSVLIEDTTVSGSGDDAIIVRNGTDLTVVGSTLTGNNDDGIDLESGSTLALVNSTISGNGQSGLQLDVGAGAVSIINSTIVNNDEFGIERLTSSAATITNSIVYGNNFGDCSGSVVSGGGNIAGDASCNLTGTGDRSNTNPLLGALAANGGATQTHLPQTGSPAIDTGIAGPCPATDQRGQARPQDGNGDGTAICDVGAVEVAALPVVTTTTAPPTTAPPTTAPAPTAPATDAPTTIAGLLPSTGVDASGTQIWTGLMLMALGAALVMGVRRRHTVG